MIARLSIPAAGVLLSDLNKRRRFHRAPTGAGSSRREEVPLVLQPVLAEELLVRPRRVDASFTARGCARGPFSRSGSIAAASLTRS